MRDLAHLKEFRVKYGTQDRFNGAFSIPGPVNGKRLQAIASNGLGWDHVSVSRANRCPYWEEMAFIKDLFFDETESVVQYHPAKKDYVNDHPFTLHLWRPTGGEKIPTPDKYLV